jgi:hypothetical protein
VNVVCSHELHLSVSLTNHNCTGSNLDNWEATVGKVSTIHQVALLGYPFEKFAVWAMVLSCMK